MCVYVIEREVVGLIRTPCRSNQNKKENCKEKKVLMKIR